MFQYYRNDLNKYLNVNFVQFKLFMYFVFNFMKITVYPSSKVSGFHQPEFAATDFTVHCFVETSS